MIDPAKTFTFTAQNGKVQWTVPPTLPYFEGHFPENPVLPAVAILDASLEVIRQTAERDPVLREVASAKFFSPIAPGTEVIIECIASPDQQWSVKWSDVHSAKRLAELRVCLRGGDQFTD